MTQKGVLLTNLGTPDAPTFFAVRRYLKEFLSDPYVIDLPKWKWWPILNLVILNIRPFRSAKNYQKIWTDQGSPLLINMQKIQSKLQQALPDRAIGLFMQYGRPKDALDGIKLPLYPQYSRTTYRDLPDTSYHDHPLYIQALADSVRTFWDQYGKPQKLLLSYHGLPQRYVDQGDPYYDQCLTTSCLLRKALGVDEDFAIMSFQSRVGAEEWLKPYTLETLKSMPQQGVDNVQVICPGFACDCLETLEEINIQNRTLFLTNGGKRFAYIPCLNDSPQQITLLLDLIS